MGNNPRQPKPISPREGVERQQSTAGSVLPRRQSILNITGYVKTVTTIPTAAPKSYEDAVLIYVDDLASPTVRRQYIFSREANDWFYVALSA